MFDDSTSRYRVHVCLGKNCSARGSAQLLAHLQRCVGEAGLAFEVEVLGTTCRNRCDFGPSMNVYPGPVFYNGFDEADIEEIVESHLKGDMVVERLRFRETPPGRETRFRR